MNKTHKNLFLFAILLIFPAIVFAAPSEENMQMKREEMKKQMEARKEQREVKKTERETERTEKKEERKAVACENITEKLAERQSRFAEDKATWQEKKAENSAERTDKRAERDAAFAEKRAEAKERRDKMYQNLLNKATTDEQKAAVETFRVGVEAAVAKRHQAIDQAMQNFRTSADAARAGKKDTRTEALTTFQSAVSSALNQAKDDCAAGLSAQEVSKKYQASVKAARETLQNTRGEEILGSQIKELAQARNASVRQAIAEYRTTLDSLLETLKAALGPLDEEDEDGEPESNNS